MRYYIGLDIGTSAAKGALMREDGKIIKVTDKKFVYITEGDFKLLDPGHFIDVCFSVIRELADSADGDIEAICACCASGNPVFLDKNGHPLTPIIGWQSKVPQSDLDAVYTKAEQDATYRIVGWDFFDGMPAADLAYIKLHKPEILEKTGMLVMNSEYFNYKLTGKWGVSRSTGTPFYLIDQEKGEYYRPTLEKFGLTEKMLPPIYEKGTVLGTVLPEISEKTGLNGSTAVVLGSFDHPSGALGAGVFDPGQVLLSCGTSWVELFPVKDREKALSTGGLVDRFMLYGTEWCVMKSVASISDKIDEARERFFGKIPYRVFDPLAASAKKGCGGLRFYYDGEDDKRAAGYGKAEIARAIIEGAACILKENLEECRRLGLGADSITAIGGITNSPECTRIISEVLEKEIKVVNGQSAGAVGSCLLAGIGTGVYKNEKEAFAKMKEAMKI